MERTDLMLALTIQSPQMLKLHEALGHIAKGVPRALAPAINRALDKGRTTVKREIRKVYLIKAKDIPMRVRGANSARLSGEIRIEQGMLSLDKFKISPRGVQKRKNKRPIRAQVKVSGGKIIRSAFMTAGGGPYMRRGADRFPIKRLLTIGASIMASQPTVGPAANKAMGDTLDKRIDHEIKRVLTTSGGH